MATQQTKAWHVRYRERVAALAVSIGKDPRRCERCGKITGRKKALHWHHRDPTTKLFELGQPSARLDAELLDELAKCERICKACHNYHHSTGAQGYTKVPGGYEVRMWFATEAEAREARGILMHWKHE